MNRDLTKQERDTLEGLVDAACLDAVLQALSDICGEKAQHIREKRNDRDLAKLWDTAAGVIGVASASRSITTLSR